MTIASEIGNAAPALLQLTGRQQARSVAAALAGDLAAADNVRLALAETGARSTRSLSVESDSAGCRGGPAPAKVDGRCVADALAKDEGKQGCGCRVAA